jgi:hypothetical protein
MRAYSQVDLMLKDNQYTNIALTSGYIKLIWFLELLSIGSATEPIQINSRNQIL